MGSNPKGRSSFQKKPAKLDDVRNEINVTPLVDVVLVLLIIMMVIGPMLARGKEVKLPQTENHAEPNDNHEPIVAIDEYGEIWVDKCQVAPKKPSGLEKCKLGKLTPQPSTDKKLAEMQQRVRYEWKELIANNAKLAGKEVDRSGENRVLLKVSPAIPYGQVYPVIMALHQLGPEGIDLGTADLEKKTAKK